jgi:hypothetical protein
VGGADRTPADGRAGVAQEIQRVFVAAKRHRPGQAAPQSSFDKVDRRVTVYYFYLWDADFGPAFIKVCAYFPYAIRVWLNGHGCAKRQAVKAGLGFTELSKGFAAATDPAGLQAICYRLGRGRSRCSSPAGWPGCPCR